jgi:hypothetical protein
VSGVRLVLPVLWCAGGCGSQLVRLLSIDGASGELLCLFCARERAADGLGLVRPLTPDLSPGMVPGAGEPVPQDEAVRLFVRMGAKLEDASLAVAAGAAGPAGRVVEAPAAPAGDAAPLPHVCPCGRGFVKGFGLRVHQRTCPLAPRGEEAPR